MSSNNNDEPPSPAHSVVSASSVGSMGLSALGVNDTPARPVEVLDWGGDLEQIEDDPQPVADPKAIEDRLRAIERRSRVSMEGPAIQSRARLIITLPRMIKKQQRLAVVGQRRLKELIPQRRLDEMYIAALLERKIARQQRAHDKGVYEERRLARQQVC